MKQPKENLILEMTFKFSTDIIAYCDLLDEHKKFQLSKQLFKSGTSIGANVREAQHPESLSDFIHKLKISAKECEESQYWLELANASEGYPPKTDLLNEAESIGKVLSKIISTSKAKLAKRRLIKFSCIALPIIIQLIS